MFILVTRGYNKDSELLEKDLRKFQLTEEDTFFTIPDPSFPDKICIARHIDDSEFDMTDENLAKVYEIENSYIQEWLNSEN